MSRSGSETSRLISAIRRAISFMRTNMVPRLWSTAALPVMSCTSSVSLLPTTSTRCSEPSMSQPDSKRLPVETHEMDDLGEIGPGIDVNIVTVVGVDEAARDVVEIAQESWCSRASPG